MHLEQPYIDLYRAEVENIKRNSAPLLNVLRDEAFEQFCRLGFPTAATENYRYIDLEETLSVDYGLNINKLHIPISAEKIFRCGISGISQTPYFVINDTFYANQPENALPKGVIISSLREISTQCPELVEKYLGQLSSEKNDALLAFNGAFAQDGFFIYIPDNVQLDKPIQLINLMRSDVDLMANSHNLVVLGKNAKAQLLVCDHCADDVRFLANRVTEVFVGENAVYEHYKLENTSVKNTNFATLLIDQKANSNVLTNIITLRGGVTRNYIEIALNGENAETTLCGMAIADTSQCVDNFTSILHNSPNCRSNELFKYILKDESLCGFTGKIFVAKDAQKTAAYQNNKNILLNTAARIRTRPQLEIYADDVKCSHGATVGQLDPNAMFYMQQRGIPREEARLLLLYAFMSNIVDNVRINSLKDRIKMMLENRLRKNGVSAGNCAMCK